MPFEKGNTINTGRKFTREHKQRLSKSNKGNPSPRKGIKLSQEIKDKISKANKGKPSPRKGVKLTKETKEKIRQANLGSKSPFWKGGISFKKYTVDWTETLKRSIRERDNYICQIVGCNRIQGDKAHAVHHIDYNKKNCNPNNLITLCGRCHAKTNHNREYWIKYFKSLWM